MPGDVIQVFHGYVQVGNETYNHSGIAKKFGIDDENHEHVRFEPHDIRLFDDKAWTTYSEQDIAQHMVGYPTTVVIHPGYTVRNGQRLDEPYTAEDPDYDLKIVDGHAILNDYSSMGELKVDGEPASPEDEARYEKAPPGPVPPGCVFAMGDNRNQSSDSTHWGPLDENRIVGKAFFIFYPFNRIRFIH